LGQVDYLGTIPRTQICGDNTGSETGSLLDDLSQLQGDGDACVYRIQGNGNDNSRIRLKIHEIYKPNECFDTDKVYIFADGKPYGPYCTRPDESKSRPKRFATYDMYDTPSRYGINEKMTKWKMRKNGIKI